MASDLRAVSPGRGGCRAGSALPAGRRCLGAPQLLGDELEIREPDRQHADALLHPAWAFGLHEDDRVVVDHVRGDDQLQEELTSITRPALLLSGEHDGLVPRYDVRAVGGRGRRGTRLLVASG